MQNEYDVIVIGGRLTGISDTSRVVRLGCKVALVQDRPHQSSPGIMAFPV